MTVVFLPPHPSPPSVPLPPSPAAADPCVMFCVGAANDAYHALLSKRLDLSSGSAVNSTLKTLPLLLLLCCCTALYFCSH